MAVELVHLASLYHDDVIDEATIRRNVESVNSRFGNLVAIVAGDYLLARSAAIAASLGTEIAALLADTLGRLCQGQVTEVRSAFQIGRSHDDYFAAISGKTAALMATSCRIGALTGGLPAAEVEACTEFGRCFGMVFQIRDDILDITATDGQLQKPAGQDLAEGIYTLPALVALADPDAGPDLRALLGQPLAQPERDKARAIVMASRGIAAAVEWPRDATSTTRQRGHRRDRPARLGRALAGWRPSCSTTSRADARCPTARRRSTGVQPATVLSSLAAGRAALRLGLGQAGVDLGLAVLHPRDPVADGGGQLGVAGRPWPWPHGPGPWAPRRSPWPRRALTLACRARAAWRTRGGRVVVPVLRWSRCRDAPAMPAAPKVSGPATAAPAMILRNMVSSLDSVHFARSPPCGGTSHSEAPDVRKL